ncbi:type IV secretory system conjugative DNA transfer VirD4/TraG family protein [Pontibacter ummariensis]|uniref:Type IV secretory system Conjugative DNA transfer n=1 Tax=Pontibacter ummariensis TaxID=1610492 RepID=A0A239DTF9_9BACT|nr:type IV secretory system conjugative DNA transfer family protein [Pontibacter ummariensis]PRY13761.1 type IV secretory system conjugative DNA transfer VirD4/TraG family protein [Pontibacter ummariensis]SNS35786.1 Type IV secretory system Conjugative DNA transfer [Pontibacter ummariensis]
MEESSELKKLYGFLQGFVYFTLFVEFAVLLYADAAFLASVRPVVERLARLPIYENIYFSKAFTFALIMIVALGTKAQKNLNFDPLKHVFLPLFIGAVLFLGSGFFYYYVSETELFYGITLFELLYTVLSLIGAVMIHVALDNVSKHIQSSLMKDKFNVENESFEQSRELVDTPYSVNIPMLYYHKRKINKGWLNIVNPFRATLLIGTPGSGKSFSVVNPFIKQMLAKGFSMALYDFKFPDLGKIAYYHYLVNKKLGPLKHHKFHVINFNSVEHSRRFNPLKPEYLPTLADATETAEALLQSLTKNDKESGAAQFFTQSAVNFLASCIFFLSRHESGRYSTFPHVMAFINQGYEEIFELLFTEPQLMSLLSPFRTAFRNKAFDQLEGQIGTLKINIGRLATKETFWVLSGDDFDLKITNPQAPSVLVIANDPSTQSINSACNALILNRMTKLINSKGNLPCGLIVDESPTLYVHKVENLIATARSNKIAVLLGLQELPQLKQQYGRETADTICSVAANVLSGSVRNKETLDWLEKIFGKVRQQKQGVSIDRSRVSVSMSEEMGPLIPASKIANLRAGEMVGQVAFDNAVYDGRHVSSTYNCKINLNLDEVAKEEEQYVDMPIFYKFGTVAARTAKLEANFIKINKDIESLIAAFQV